jgi:hypothetical protein
MSIVRAGVGLPKAVDPLRNEYHKYEERPGCLRRRASYKADARVPARLVSEDADLTLILCLVGQPGRILATVV